MRFKSLLLLASLSTSVFASNRIEKLIFDYDLKPLAESDYWKEHPNELPYDECKLFAADGSRVQGNSWGLPIVQYTSHRQEFTLFCFSTKEKLAFQLPITLDKDYKFGLTVGANPVTYTKGHARGLHKKKLTDLFGNFKGFSGSLGFITSASGAFMRHNGITLSLNESGGVTLLDFGASIRVVHVGPRVLNEEEVYSAYFLDKRDALQEAAQTKVADIYSNGDTDDYIAKLEEERIELSNWEDSRKYSSTWKYWIHHLDNHVDHSSTAQQCQQRQHQRGSCHKSYTELLSQLDYDFLTSLVFKKIRKHH
jgi:hypothetical protein